MTDLTPPPERDLEPERRSAIRAVLGTEESQHRPVVPVLAAAAVVAVVGGAAVAVPALTDDRHPPTGGSGPGLTTTTTTTTTPRTTVRPNTPPPPRTTAGQSNGRVDPKDWPTPTAKPSLPPEQTCRAMLAGYRTSPSGSPVKTFADAPVEASLTGRWGTSMIFAENGRWVGCDTAGYRFNHGSIRAPASTAPPAVTDNDTFAVSQYAQSKTWKPNSVWYHFYWAAGVLPDGVAKISYTFPDGGTEQADVTGRFWLMQHAPDEPLQEGVPEGDPIKVTLSRSDGSVIRTFSLRWGEQTCAHINHGC